MKKNIALFLLFSTLLINAQSYDDASEASKLCLLVQGSIGNNFIGDRDAEAALDKILSVIGASKRFILQPCNKINNAVATSFKGLRYILYDKEFMNTIANQSNSWTKLFILAHEVGHHINGHSIDILLAAADILETKTLSEKRKQELESDEFAGFILGKLGATLNQTCEAINLLASNKDDTYSTHPTKTKRLNAIKIGYNKALLKEPVVYERKTNLNIVEEYFYMAIEKSKKEDYYGAISDFTKAIKINPNFPEPYVQRGFAKDKLKDYYGAIADYTKAIEINPNEANFYTTRGISRLFLKDYYEAISDYTKAIDINPNDATSYRCRGNAKALLKDYYGAISDYTKAININPEDTDYKFRGKSKYRLKDYYSAINDYNKAIKINPNDADTYNDRARTKFLLKDYYGAIADFTKTIEFNPNDADKYLNRGICKAKLKDMNGACLDGRKAQQLGYNSTQLTNVVCK